nr:MAG TPA: hypothetical protein [Caudoviricetes sp.]
MRDEISVCNKCNFGEVFLSKVGTTTFTQNLLEVLTK